MSCHCDRVFGLEHRPFLIKNVISFGPSYPDLPDQIDYIVYSRKGMLKIFKCRLATLGSLTHLSLQHQGS